MEDIERMANYRYATALRATNDGKPPNDNIEKGDIILKAGKHESDQITYLDADNEIASIAFEQDEVFDAGEANYSKDRIIDLARAELSE